MSSVYEVDTKMNTLYIVPLRLTQRADINDARPAVDEKNVASLQYIIIKKYNSV